MTATKKSDSHAYSGLKHCDTNSATYIPWQEVKLDKVWQADYYPSEMRQWYRKMDDYNNGYRNGGRINDRYYTGLAKFRLMGAITSNLNLLQREAERAQAFFSKLDTQKFGLELERAAFAICCFVIESDDLDERRAHPAVRDRRMAEVINLQSSLGLSEKDVASDYGKIASKYRNEKRSGEGVYKSLRIQYSESVETSELEWNARCN